MERTARTRWAAARRAGMLVASLVSWAFLSYSAHAGHSAFVVVVSDPAFNLFTGTSNPPGLGQVNAAGGVPGYLNGISGGQNGGANGSAAIIWSGSTCLVGIAIEVADTAGPTHSLSTLNDPALGDIVTDLNADSGGFFSIVAYPYDKAPVQFSAAQAALTAGESTAGGRPFDIFLVGTPNVSPSGIWSFSFANEVGNLDGITALNVTDIGAVPEPADAAGVCLGLALMVRRRTPKLRS